MLNLKYFGDDHIYSVSFTRLSDNIVICEGENLDLKQSGFTLSRIGHEDNWDYSNFTTIYKEEENKIYFSNNGEVWVPPVYSIAFSVTWNDLNNHDELRPENISLRLENGKEITLNADNNWEYTFYNLPSLEGYAIDAEAIPAIDEYDVNLSGGHTVVYSHNVEIPDPNAGLPTLEERLADLEAAICELYEIQEAMMEG